MIMKLILSTLLVVAPAAAAVDLGGAWQHVRDDGATGTWIVSGEHFSIAWYQTEPAKFVSTSGGTWAKTEQGIRVTWEFDTATPDNVGSSREMQLDGTESAMTVDGVRWSRVDSGAPGALEGAWLMTGRERDGEISTRRPGVRRTMKILSGTRFQWIAYNVETKEFFGSGGGTYTTIDGRYVESLEFFSRDDSRTGQSLDFAYELQDGVWHHIGKSTRGDPMHEVWETRKALGI
jgi:hypothetical protein